MDHTIFNSAVLSIIKEYVPIIPLLSTCKDMRRNFEYYQNNWFYVKLYKFPKNRDSSSLKKVKVNRLSQLKNKSPSYIIFSDSFNEPTDQLPLSLKYLEFGYSFNQEVNKLPRKLIHLPVLRGVSG